jgi:lysozyme family protein
LERSNGLGYQKRGLFSPYLWGGTTLYERGKFAGGVWDPNAVNAQVGAVALLRRLQDKNVIDLHAANVAASAQQ